MDIVYGVVLILHLIGMAGVVGGWLATIRQPGVATIIVHGALTALVAGLLLVGLSYAPGVDRPVDNAKIGVKLVVALAVAVLAWTFRKGTDVPRRITTVIGGLATLNVAIAVLWD